MTTRYLRGSIIYNEHDPLDRGLVGEWRFDRNTGEKAPEDSDRNVAMDVSSAAGWTTTAQGIGLDCQANINTLVSAETYGPVGFGACTIEVFFRLDALSGAAQYTKIFSFWQKAGAASILGGYGIRGDGVDSIRYELVTNDTLRRRQIAGVPAIGDLVHSVLTYDGSAMQGYKNGQPDGALVAATGILDDRGGSNTEYLLLDSGGTAHQFVILEARIYNRSLTAAEVHARYQLARRRMQTFGGERRFPVGFVAVAPPVGPFLTTGGGYSLPVG